MNILKQIKCISTFIVALIVFAGCQSDSEDSRVYEPARINAVKLNGELFLASTQDNVVTVNTPDGRSLEATQLQILLSNGELQNFTNGSEVDCRFPIPLSVVGSDGSSYDFTLKVVSRPKLASFVIDGVELLQSVQSETKILAQVPVGTDVSALRVSMQFVNGELQGFVNGEEYNYSEPRSFSILGVDEQTVYPYSLVVTDKTIGPAAIEAMTINGIPTTQVVVTDAENAVVVPYIDGLTDFSSATITITAGLENEIDPEAQLSGLNLYSGNNKVKITGSNGSTTEFTIGVPMISSEPTYKLEYSDIKVGGTGNAVSANAVRGAALSGDHVVLSAQNTNAGLGLYYNYKSGEYAGSLNINSAYKINWGLHKVASDVNGTLLYSELGLTSGTQTIHKWSSVTGEHEKFLEFSSASIGSELASYRNAGISIDGDLSTSARVIMTTAQRAEAFVWSVENGVVSSSPTRFTPAVNQPNYYWTVSALAGGDNFVASVPSSGGSALWMLNSTMSEILKVSGLTVSDAKTISYKGRTYLAYIAYSSGKGAFCRLLDVTDGDLASYTRYIMDYTFEAPSAGMGNGCAAIDMKVSDEGLTVMYFHDNIGAAVFEL